LRRLRFSRSAARKRRIWRSLSAVFGFSFTAQVYHGANACTLPPLVASISPLAAAVHHLQICTRRRRCRSSVVEHPLGNFVVFYYPKISNSMKSMVWHLVSDGFFNL
jgi:hypothetical protein